MLRISRPWPNVMNAGEFPVAEAYAGAALDNLPSDAEAEEASAELLQIEDLLKSSPEMNYLLFQAPVSVSARCELVEKVFARRCSPATHALLGVLARRNRLHLLRVIAARFRALLDRRQGKMHVPVTTAFDLDEPARQTVTEAIVRKLGGRPVLRLLVDPSLVGGMVVSVGGRVYDDSIQTELERMRERLAASFARRPAAGE